MDLKLDASVGYLPEERPPVGKLILYALQQVIVMFPATVTVALITGFQVSTTIFASGLATLFFILITRQEDPPVLRLQLRLSDGHFQHGGRRGHRGADRPV